MLDAKTGTFSRKMQQAARQSKMLGGGVGFLNSKLAALGGLLVGGITIRGLTNMIGTSMKLLDVLAKTSDKLGIDSKALAGLQHAANITGVSVEAMTKGLQNMARRVAEATEGTGEGVDALNALGLSANNLSGLTMDQQFLAIADAMGRVGNQGKKVQVAFDLFGRGGVDMLNTMALGRDGLQQMMQEADALGIAMNRVDLAKVEQANDAMTRVKGAMQGIKNVAAVELAPAIETLSTMFTDWLLSSKDGVTVLGKGIDALVGTIGKLGDAINWMRKMAVAAQAGLLKMAQAPLAFAGKWLKGDRGGDFAANMANALEDQIGELHQKWNALSKGPSFSERFAEALAGTEAAAMKAAAEKVAQVVEPITEEMESKFLGFGQGQAKQVNFATGFRANNPVSAASAQANRLAQSIANATQQGTNYLRQIAENTSGGTFATVAPG